MSFDFGDYALIEQKRFGAPNEMFVYKVVSQISSNAWVEVPVTVGKKEEIHYDCEPVCLCICCGVDETEVRKFRVKDMQKVSK
ncbi:hypothetical protein [Enterobacter sp. UPMP2052]